MEILILRGLPAAGKTTWAKEKLKEGGWKRVNKDDLRAMMDDSKWSKKNEKFVLQIRDNIILEALSEGYSVVVDDTNLSSSHYERIVQLTKELDVVVSIDDHFLKVPIEECIERDLKRPVSVGEKVIRRMYNESIREKQEYIAPEKPLTILCDIDGTLAKMSGRSPYDWKRVGEDTINAPVADLLESMKKIRKIILVSGRDGSCMEETKKWLEDWNVDYDALYMRPVGDSRKDCIVKREIFDKCIKDNYAVDFVLDDRNQVVEMWRDLGLTCFQVDEGDF